MHHLVCSQQAVAYWTNLCGEHHTNQWYLQQLQREVILVIQGAGHVDRKQDGACPHTVNVVLNVLHDVYDSHVLLYCGFPECFWVGWYWPPCSLNVNPCDYFLWGFVFTTPICTLLGSCKQKLKLLLKRS